MLSAKDAYKKVKEWYSDLIATGYSDTGDSYIFICKGLSAVSINKNTGDACLIDTITAIGKAVAEHWTPRLISELEQEEKIGA